LSIRTSAKTGLSRLTALIEAGGPEIAVVRNELQFADLTGKAVTERFGSPLYLYSERILRRRCQEVANFLSYRPFVANYSCKANTNVALLKIAHSEGLHADAMSPGEIMLLREAGFATNQIFYVGNNVDDAELLYAITAGVTISVDSLAQLERLGRLNPGGKVAVRINPGIGDGHHQKVVTGGADSKFGVYYTQVDEIKRIANQYLLQIVGLNQHIGSNFLNGETYLASVERMLEIALKFDDLDFIDFGGGFGIPYTSEQSRLDITSLGDQVSEMLERWVTQYGKRITAQIEPGRYVVAECGVLLITVHALKETPERIFIGTDGGFNVLVRPTMYDAYHEIVNTRLAQSPPEIEAYITGNICESGDLLAQRRPMPKPKEQDVLAVLDAGAYGFSMSSNYNARLRPAEVLLTLNNELQLIRERDTLEDLLRHQIY
jgi:diaminopimelate decarboxylase